MNKALARNHGRTVCALLAGVLSLMAVTVHAALLAYEPCTNATGANLIGSADGLGFNGGWQSNNSSGVATNTGHGLGYTDGASNTLVTVGGAGFFQGLTTANNSMQPIRLFNSGRGTNGVDGVTTWISLLVARQGPTGTLSGNPYGRGANLPHDLDTGAIQKLAIGNSSGSGSNTVGLIPTGSAANLKGSTNEFGGVTNFLVVHIDHVAGAANDNAYLFVNPQLSIEPSTNDAGAVSLNGFDFSFDRLRVFAGGQNSAAQPYAELLVDEYRLGESYADVAPVMAAGEPPGLGGLRFTNATLIPGHVVLAGTGGPDNGAYHLLTSATLGTAATNWPAVATNNFDANGSFVLTNPLVAGADGQFFRLRLAPPVVPMVPPEITTQPSNVTVTAGGSTAFTVEANGSPVLRYQWYFNTNVVLAGATNASYPVVNVQPHQAGSYLVVVTNDYGVATSAVAMLTVISPPLLLPGAYFVSPTGLDSNPGTEESPFLTLTKGLNTITTSGTIYLRGGTYAQPTKLSLSRTGTTNGAIRFWAYPGETPVINSAGNSSDGLAITGRNYHLKGLTVVNAGHNGINISGHSNVIEFCTVRSNGNTGLHITGGSSGSTYPSYNLILNCDAYLNCDPPDGGDADGFSAKWNLGPGNVFRGCRAWWNSDDGWDLWMGTTAVLIDQCWAFYNGTNYWNDPLFNGNGNGFKLGGQYVGTPHRIVRSLAFRNQAHGIDQNNNVAGQTVDNNTCWANLGRNINLNHNSTNAPMTGNHLVQNNLSFAGGNSDSFWPGTVEISNSWQVVSSPAANAGDVLSVDDSAVTAPRNPNGSLPNLPFLRPVPGGRLIDKGVILTEPYAGAAPDLGAFEDDL